MKTIIRKDIPSTPLRIVSIRDARPANAIKSKRHAFSTLSHGMDAILKRLDQPARKLSLRDNRLLEVLGLSTKALVTRARELSPTGLLALIEALGEELRRLNNLAADAEGVTNEQAQSLTAGEARLEGLGKSGLGQPGAAADVDVLYTRRLVEERLQAVLDLHEELARNAPVNDGDIQLSRGNNNALSLDALSKYADRQNRIAAILQHQPDDDGGASALGVSKQSQAVANRIEKTTRNTVLPADSWTGNNQPLATKLQKQAENLAQPDPSEPLPWYMRGVRR